MPETHADDVCKSRTCRYKCGDARVLKVVSKLAQRVQRQCTGYYCGCTFKPQPIGSKFVRLASRSLNYLEEGLKDKSWGQRWHRLTHRVLIDQNHRCMRRTAPEEWNLASGMADHDVTKAEFIRTYQSVDFNGRALLRKLETYQKQEEEEINFKPLPASQAEAFPHEIWLRHFPDLYGFRYKNDHNPGLFLLSPWEFLSYWECLQLLPPRGKNDDLSMWIDEGDGIYPPIGSSFESC